jgi:hypothetical protein
MLRGCTHGPVAAQGRPNLSINTPGGGAGEARWGRKGTVVASGVAQLRHLV